MPHDTATISVKEKIGYGLGDAAAAQYKASSLLDEKKRTDAVGYWKRSLDINPEQPRIAAQVTEYSKGGLVP